MMKAALEEYNKTNNGSNSNFKQSNTLPPQSTSFQKPDTQDETRRRRGATVIGTRELPQFNNISMEANSSTNNSSNTAIEVPNSDDNYNTIKMRYLRTLKIPINMPTKEATPISASAPIPIPIALNLKDDFDSDEESDDEPNGGGHDDDSLLGTTLQNEHLLSSTLDTTSQFMIPSVISGGIGSMLVSSKISKPDINSDNNNIINNNNNNSSNNNIIDDKNNSINENIEQSNGDDVVPVRKDSRKHKFIPPHELMNTTNTTTIENMINHSLPGNNKRKVFGQ